MALLEITNENFNEIVNSNETVLVDFFATWCGPCKMMSPIIDEIAEENPAVTVGKCDVDEADELAEQFEIMSIPTIMVFKNGAPAKTFVGLTDKQAIVNEL